MNKLLQTLASEAFAVKVGFLLPPLALRRQLQRFEAVRQIERAVREGAITETEVQEFTGDVVRHFQPGFLLPGELALAALAVALQFCPQDFAEEYLCHLARLNLAELRTAIRVARECLTARHARPKNQVKRFVFKRTARRVRAGFRVLSPRPADGWRPAAGRARYAVVGA